MIGETDPISAERMWMPPYLDEDYVSGLVVLKKMVEKGNHKHYYA